MKAIVTRYHGPTNSRGARISASDLDGNRVSIPYPHELSGEACHAKAAEALARKLEWKGNWRSGAVREGYVFTSDETVSFTS